MTKRKIALLLILGSFVLIGVAVSMLLFTDTSLIANQIARPQVTLTPPISLSEWGETYPELSEVLQDPELGSTYKEFLIVYQEDGEEAAITLAKERGLLTPGGGNLRIMLVLDTHESASLQRQLEDLGVTIVSAYQDRVNISVPVELITETMTSTEIENAFSQLTELQHVIAVRLPPQNKSDEQETFGEGISVINADTWHDAGFTGKNIHIGILDLGFADYQGLLGYELPEEVIVETFGWYDEEESHGTACAEIIHEIAPDARLSFAWYDGSNPAMGEAVEWLVDQNVNIISHSAGGIVGPRDGSGWDAQLVDDLAAQNILWVNSAGNEAKRHYRGIFTDEDGDGYHEYTSKEEMLPLYNEGYLEVYLLWEDMWTAATQDYELYIVDAEGEPLAISEDTQDGTEGQQPVEWITIEPSEAEVYAVVVAYETERAATFDLFVLGPNVEIPDAIPGYSLGTPADAHEALAVGAIDWDDDRLASYSSQGPTNDGRLKPEVSAPTGISGATYGRYGFDGTSASAPHVAGAAALIWQAHSEFERGDVFDYLTKNTQDLGPPGPDTAYGYGRLLLPAPPEAIIATPTATSSAPDATVTSVPATAAPILRPTSTAVSFVTPAPPLGDGDDSVIFGLTAVGLIVGGLGLGGMGFLIGGSLLLATRSTPAPSHTLRSIPPKHPPSSLPPESQQSIFSPAALLSTPQDPSLAQSRCPICNTPVRSNAKFCQACGRPIVGSLASTVKAKPASRYCRYCGAKLRVNAKFCPKCGRELIS